MSEGCGPVCSLRIHQNLVARLGPAKKQGDRISPDTWKGIFDVVTELKVPHGWIAAVAEWTKLSTWTVKNRWDNSDTAEHHRGRPSLLPPIIENTFAHRINERAFVANAMVTREVRTSLRALTSKFVGVATGGSKGQLRGLLHRHPELARRTAERTPSVRSLGPTHAGSDKFYDNCEELGVPKTLAHKIINVDEAAAKTNRDHSAVIGPRWSVLKRISTPAINAASHTSIVVAAKANGLPHGKPIFILCGAHINANSLEDTDDYLVICTKSGGMEGYAWEECCKYWSSIGEEGDIYIVDGHSSHTDFLAVTEMKNKGREMLTLDPHCTHVLQVSTCVGYDATWPDRVRQEPVC